tara:strand:- start:381 stop:1358 length:978 start_codon:yes stop_codon:yes gene_type:complete
LGVVNKKIFVAGHNGMVGSAIIRKLNSIGNCNIITAERKDLDLTNQLSVNTFFKENPIDVVILAAAKVGGIHANNTKPADFIYENLMIEANIIFASYQNRINDVLFLGSSCIYPKNTQQPMSEESLLSGFLEPTNEPYAIAKIAGIKLCESFNRQFSTNYRSLMPTNLYGPNDNFHPMDSHVVPALIGKFHNATKKGEKEVIVWGSGRPRREFLHVDDLASASIFFLSLSDLEIANHTTPMNSHVNVGTGKDYSISELAEIIANSTGFEGNIIFDTEMPDGTLRKLLDVTKMKDLGWSYSIPLDEGIDETYSWFKQNISKLRGFN